MKLIEITALSNGAHRNQTYNGSTVPDGWAVIPDGMAVPDTFPFVNLTVDGQTVTSMTAGTIPEPEPEPDPEPTAEDITLDLMAEHEERLCMLEITTGI
nr:MAG TPA: hypothetical protein [Caudoviricetes sp.]